MSMSAVMQLHVKFGHLQHSDFVLYKLNNNNDNNNNCVCSLNTVQIIVISLCSIHNIILICSAAK